MKTKTSNTSISNKTGYLNNQIEFFYLKDNGLREIESHYHEFHKVLILLKGTLDYQIEGRTFSLKENDIVLVPANSLHRPILKPCDCYERLIIYLSNDYLTSSSDSECDLSILFQKASDSSSYIIRPSLYPSEGVSHIISELIEETVTKDFGHKLYRNTLFLQLLIKLNRLNSNELTTKDFYSESDNKISEIINYINLHLTEDLSVDSLAEKFYISRYYLMHIFKEKTGYTLGAFISTKRLILAKELIENGTPVTSAAFECGYNSYSAFSRAYGKQFNKDKNSTIRE